MGQCLLILCARSLNNFSEGIENLTCDTNGFEEIDFTRRVDQFLAWIMPVEVHDRLLQSQQVIDSADDDIDGGRITSLGS